MQRDHGPASALRGEKQGPRFGDHCFYVKEVGVQAKSGGKTVRIFKWGSEGSWGVELWESPSVSNKEYFVGG